MTDKTRNIINIAVLCAIAFAAVAIGRVPIVLFLKYDPKDTIIALGGFLFGPMASFYVSVIVSAVEMLTISETGILGCLMNIVSSCSFACIASLVYQKKKTLRGAVIGLAAGCITMICIMLLWNYFITPIYMGYPKEAVARLLLPVFLPFNLLKGGLNAVFTFLLYKPIVQALRKTGTVKINDSKQPQKHIGLMVFSGIIIAACILFILFNQRGNVT